MKFKTILGSLLLLGSSLVCAQTKRTLMENLSASNTSFYLNTSTQKLGIGTSSPSERLDVQGNIKSTGTIIAPQGTIDNLIVIIGTASNITISNTVKASTVNVTGRYQINCSNVLAIPPGGQNIAVGVNAGTSTTTGARNTFVGQTAGALNTTGTDNTFLGASAGIANISGVNNTFVGKRSGYTNSTGLSNTFVGNECGYYTTTGTINTFVGYQAGYNNIAGIGNNFIGVAAGHENTLGNSNSFLGYWTGYYNTEGYENTFLGNTAGYKNTIGYQNVAVGKLAGFSNVNGYRNTFLGVYAGYYSLGSSNTFVGNFAGFRNTTGSNNIAIGAYADFVSTTSSNQLNIGNVIYGDLLSGNIGIGTISPSEKLFVVGNSSITGIVTASTFNAVGTAYQFNGTSIYDADGFHGDGSGLTGISYLDTTVTNSLYVDNKRSDIYVENGSITKPFKTIQSAINAIISPSSTNKYTIYIAPGANYSDPITVDKIYTTFRGAGFNGTRISGKITIATPSLSQITFEHMRISGGLESYVSHIAVNVLDCDVTSSSWTIHPTTPTSDEYLQVWGGLWYVDTALTNVSAYLMGGGYYSTFNVSGGEFNINNADINEPFEAILSGTIVGSAFGNRAGNSKFTLNTGVNLHIDADTEGGSIITMAGGTLTRSTKGSNIVNDSSVTGATVKDALETTAVNLATVGVDTAAITNSLTNYVQKTSTEIISGQKTLDNPANILYGDGSNLTGISAGDNFGNHVATMTVDMAQNYIVNATTITGVSIPDSYIGSSKIIFYPAYKEQPYENFYYGGSLLLQAGDSRGIDEMAFGEGGNITLKAGNVDTNFLYEYGGSVRIFAGTTPAYRGQQNGNIEFYTDNELILSIGGGVDYAAKRRLVGIGTGVPSEKLEVVGNIKSDFGIIASTGVFSSSVTASSFFGDGSHLTNITQGELVTATTFQVHNDGRLDLGQSVYLYGKGGSFGSALVFEALSGIGWTGGMQIYSNMGADGNGTWLPQIVTGGNNHTSLEMAADVGGYFSLCVDGDNWPCLYLNSPTTPGAGNGDIVLGTVGQSSALSINGPTGDVTIASTMTVNGNFFSSGDVSVGGNVDGRDVSKIIMDASGTEKLDEYFYRGLVWCPANQTTYITTASSEIENVQLTQKGVILLDAGLYEVFASSFSIQNSNLTDGASFYWLMIGK